MKCNSMIYKWNVTVWFKLQGEISSFLTFDVLETDVIEMSHLSFQRDIRVDVFD